MNKTFKIFGLFMLLASFSSQSQATLVESINLETLVSASDVIVKARAIDRTVEIEDDMFVDYFTFEVLETLKGEPTSSSTLIFKQYGQGEYREGTKVYRQNIFAPSYQMGKTYLLFLPEASARTGMLLPVGNQQGVYQILQKNGQEIVPDLSSRRGALSRNLKNTQFLSAHPSLSTNLKDNSYKSFKTLIQLTLGDDE